MTASKIVLNAASGAGSDTLDIDNVFRTFLYDGDGSGRGIVNNIDLLGEGGLVWTKCRTNTFDHHLTDTVRGATKRIRSNDTSVQTTDAQGVTSFENDGYNLGTDSSYNSSSHEYVSWTWRKAPKFFDVVTYVGNGSTQNISHNLNSVPGMMLVKCLDNGGNWRVFHTSVGNTKGGYLSETLEFDDDLYWNDTTPTSTVFTVGNKSDTNGNGLNYIAYLFAHNNNDGEFGPNSDQDIIKCGSYTGNGTNNGTKIVDVGFEPQFLMVKRATGGNGNWIVLDTKRNWDAGSGNKPRIQWHSSVTESPSGSGIGLRNNGFDIWDTDPSLNNSGDTYIYMAIRNGPLNTPENATEVFHVNNYSGNSNSNVYNAGFDVDMNIHSKTTASDNWNIARMMGTFTLQTNATGSAAAQSGQKFWNDATNIINLDTSWYGSESTLVSWSWKRAPNYFDVVTYKGTGSARTINHQLGVAPEMMWVKIKNGSYEWSVYHKDVGNNRYLKLNTDDTYATDVNRWNNTAPTASVFSVGNADETNRGAGYYYIAYLFATLDGISKVGYYTGSSSSAVTVDCGFSSGARFVLIKNIHTAGDWYLFDSVRGINSTSPTDDPWIGLNLDTASTTNANYLYPANSGFQVVQSGSNPISTNGNVYIFYAIA